MNVSDLMSRETVTIDSAETVKKAAQVMADNQKGFLPVMNKKQRVIGVLSNTDIIDKVVSNNIDPESILVSDIMTYYVIKVGPETSATEAMELMRKHRIKRLVVMDNHDLIGVISTNDLLDAVLNHKKELMSMALRL
ncbi:CBS domain-containing protein [Candidatus Woesearchaeota archaeon]|nr:CBS domain-containing protein [Candidatus Woesearchaeota archaeon]